MEDFEKTSAENTLSSMAIIVLILGILGTVVSFFSLCVLWDYSGMDGISWAGIPTTINILIATLLGWSLLKVMVEISVNIRTLRKLKSSDKVEVRQGDDWRKEFAVFIAFEQKDKARELLYRSILNSDLFKRVVGCKTPENRDILMKDLNDYFCPYLRAIGEESFKVNLSNNIYDIFK